ncbi:hypothetical protein [Actinosynnema sp. NPDC023587]|uniref:hypothetical protein n=1 Tax=Actinosynnema sp. NPDC023587 TaxID=3154695 RepID=UPI00340D6065
MSQRLWLIGIIADVAAVAAVLAGSALNIAVVVGAVALLLGGVQLVTSLGKPVDRWVLLAVAGIVAGAVTITLVVTRSLDDPAQAGSTTAGTTTTSAAAGPTTEATQQSTQQSTQKNTRVEPAPATPEISRMSGDHPIHLTDDYALDLDSQESVWIAQPNEGTGSGQDLKYDASYLWASAGIAPAKAESTFEECLRAGYVGYIGAEDLVTDAAFCVKTNTGAHARIVIRAMKDQQMTLDVVVWQKPTG